MQVLLAGYRPPFIVRLPGVAPGATAIGRTNSARVSSVYTYEDFGQNEEEFPTPDRLPHLRFQSLNDIRCIRGLLATGTALVTQLLFPK